MSGDKLARDQSNNQRFKDIYVHASQEPWIPFFPGIDFKVLRATQETGHWTVLLKCAKGSGIPRTKRRHPRFDQLPRGNGSILHKLRADPVHRR